MTKRHEASPWEVLSWRFEPHRVRSFFSNIFVGCVNFYVIWSTNPIRVDSLNINTFEEKRTPRSTAHTVSPICQICYLKNYLQRSYVLFDAIPPNSMFLVTRLSVSVDDFVISWWKWNIWHFYASFPVILVIVAILNLISTKLIPPFVLPHREVNLVKIDNAVCNLLELNSHFWTWLHF